jgi:glycerate dehydrogenase
MAALPNNPHLRAKHCIVAPQIVWASKEARRRLLNTAIAKLRGFMDGPPLNVVN